MAEYTSNLEVPFEDLFEYWDAKTEGGKNIDAIRALCLWDRYFLLVQIFGRKDLLHPWLYARCREAEADPDGHLDLWARAHYKSTIITYAGAIQEILKDPDLTIGLFSHTSPIAKAFLKQIKLELERNDKLKDLFPHILWKNPQAEAPSWSVDAGIVVKRKANKKEATVEAHGLVDGQPTSKHFDLLIYDDVVVAASVSTPEQVAKTTEAYQLSDNLGTEHVRKWMVGTRWSFADSYDAIIKTGAVNVRMYPATHDGTMTGKPVLLSPEVLARKMIDQGDYVFSCNCAGTTILMGDWSYKNIEDVQVGDEVVGFKRGGGGGAPMTLVKTKVLAIQNREAEANRYTTDTGASVECTPDHKWWDKKSSQKLLPTQTEFEYKGLGTGAYFDLRRLARLAYHVEISADPRWQYLAGLLDGEGHLTETGIITIAQSPSHNPEVYKRIHEILSALGITYKVHYREAYEHGSVKSQGSAMFSISGGRHFRHKLLLNTQPAKKQKLIESLYCAIKGASSAPTEELVKIEPLGIRTVYSLQTETGNYIANGFGSKNCQMLQNPIAGTARMFDPDDLNYYEIRPSTLNVYILCDPARSKKKGSDNTAMAVVGIDAGYNKYLLDGFNHKMNLSERWENLARLWMRWKQAPGVQYVKVGYEAFAAQADLDYFQEQMRLTKLHFPIEELMWPREGEGSKVDRVQRLGPDIKEHKVLLPAPTGKTLTKNQQRMENSNESYRIARPIRKKGDDGRPYDLGEQLVEQVTYFPFAAKKDLIDALSRIYDMEPKAPSSNEPQYSEPEFV